VEIVSPAELVANLFSTVPLSIFSSPLVEFRGIVHLSSMKNRVYSCEVWCPSGSDDDCPDDQLCMAFTACHAATLNALTLKQIEEKENEVPAGAAADGGGAAVGDDASAAVNDAGNSGGGGVDNDDLWWEPETGGGGSGGSGGDGVTRKPTKRPTNKPSITAEEAMHRHSFCGKFWDDVSRNEAVGIDVFVFVSGACMFELVDFISFTSRPTYYILYTSTG
jgi:hypothetical protein